METVKEEKRRESKEERKRRKGILERRQHVQQQGPKGGCLRPILTIKTHDNSKDCYSLGWRGSFQLVLEARVARV
jgi:hypothetical protein